MLQQFREAIPGDHEYKFVIHDRDSIFSGHRQRVEVIWLQSITNAGAGVKGECLLRTPDRHDTTRVFRLGHPAERKASAENAAGVGLHITIEDAHMQVWDQGFQILGGLHHECWLQKIAA